MTLPDAGGGDLDEPGLGAQGFYIFGSAISHTRPQSADELIDVSGERTFVRNLAFDAFGNEFGGLHLVFLEIAIPAAALHGAERSHPAIDLEGAAMVDDGFAGSLFRARKQVSDHHATGAGRDGFGNISGLGDAPVRDDGDVVFVRDPGAVVHGRDLGDAHTRDHAGGADGRRPDADFDGVRAHCDQILSRFRGGDISGDQVHIGIGGFEPARGLEDPFGMPVGGVNDDHIHPVFHEGGGAFRHIVGHPDGRAHPQSSQIVLACVGEAGLFLDVLDRDQPFEHAVLVHDRQLLDPVSVKNFDSFLRGDAFGSRDQPFFGHDRMDRLVEVAFETEVAVGENAHQFAALCNRHTGDVEAFHYL